MGRCERLCTGTAQDPACPEGYFCAQGWGLNDVVCVPDCDPLAQDCPSATDACNLMSGQWGCYPRDSTTKGDARWPCSFPNDCAPFFACVREEDFAGCSNSHGACCAPICDLEDPDADSVCAAAGLGLSCKPWPPEGEPAGYDHVGACIP
ncbi:MAG: hypothetical protein IAG13_28350 [Deltaproteobacteria bacterium]|nr:hypothetical protein [Nannocystaceae bacterium]